MTYEVGLARINGDTVALYLDNNLISSAQILNQSDWLRLLRQIPGVRLQTATIRDAELRAAPSTWAAVVAAQQGEADRTQEAQRLERLVAEKQAELAALEARLARRNT